MSKTIRVSMEVYEAMKEKAKPFTDTPDSVLRREFGLDVKPPDTRCRPLRYASSPTDPGRCKAITANGDQCSRRAKKDIHFCGTHWTPERKRTSEWERRVEE